MARVRRNWTAAEDELLRRAVRAAEKEQRPLLWRELAKAVPGRSNKDCRRRWWNSLSEGNAKGPWTEEEDERLTAAVQKHGTNWTLVSRDVKTRSSDQCSSHWSHVLDPNINYCDWDEQEDADLLHQVHTYGTRWAYIASMHTPIRTTLALKNRYSTLRLKSENKNRTRQGSSSTETSWSRAASIETAMTSPSGHWSPEHSHMSHWAGSTDATKFSDDMDMDVNGGETEEDDEDDHAHRLHPCPATTPQDLPTTGWPHHPSSLKVDDASSMPFLQASFASWDAWAKLNDCDPSDGTHVAASCHLGSPVEVTPHMDAESYFPLDPPLLMNRAGGPLSASMPHYCFFGGDEDKTTTTNATTTTCQDAVYSIYDDDTCRQLSPHTTTSPSELAVTPAAHHQSGAAPDMAPTEKETPAFGGGGSKRTRTAAAASSSSNACCSLNELRDDMLASAEPHHVGGGWTAATTTTAAAAAAATATPGATAGAHSSSGGSPTTSPFPQWLPEPSARGSASSSSSSSSSASALESLLSSPSSALRVSISMTCHPGQLADVMTQMSNYGSGVTVNVQTDE